jgi:monofunctional biosynthetic peptidoglycan transglycosylase
LVARDGLDACVYQGIAPPKNKTPPVSRAPRELPGEEYESAQPLPPLDNVVEELPAASDQPLLPEQPDTTNAVEPAPAPVSEPAPAEPPPANEL